MKTTNMKKRALVAISAAFFAGSFLAPASASAQGDRGATRLLVPYAAGGATDIMARQLAEKLGELWKAPVVVENRPGAAGTIASREAAQSKPDGRTLIIVTSAHSINDLVYQKLPYDTLADFTPISQVADISNVVLASKASGYTTLKQALEAGKADPNGLSYGTAGVGTSVHLAGELLSSMTGVPMTPVHYKGDQESIVALAGGQIPLSINTVPGARAQIEAGRVTALAVTGGTRSSLLKDVPTVAESGVSDYATGNWFGILGPASMDAAVVQQLNADIAKVLGDPALAARVEGLGLTVKTGTPQEFDALIRSDIDMWRPIIKKLNLRNG
ncbi:Bug family tripartite tricarboxylate transporter substrate binding protein [Paracandidimonas soli]|uniref:Tripartite-type tricarboxylate transporter receptor subunit TctC n=1 Tax=Paracandidimonas soli TaxID=1917182 RepID=A0A4R3UYY0_9BURK|nr:tripartite tricarboxylate transporter substrate binding protein [Paracandidimonas soli]TCU96083.1 tripartite-type tricarboxylate transporter receptor subunit TctC [Paracandidimonas soli]